MISSSQCSSQQRRSSGCWLSADIAAQTWQLKCPQRDHANKEFVVSRERRIKVPSRRVINAAKMRDQRYIPSSSVNVPLRANSGQGGSRREENRAGAALLDRTGILRRWRLNRNWNSARQASLDRAERMLRQPLDSFGKVVACNQSIAGCDRLPFSNVCWNSIVAV